MLHGTLAMGAPGMTSNDIRERLAEVAREIVGTTLQIKLARRDRDNGAMLRPPRRN